MLIASEPGGGATFPTIYVADRHGTEVVRAVLSHLHRTARHRGVRPPRVILNSAPLDAAGCGPAVLLLVERQPVAEDLVAWWEQYGSGPALPVILCRRPSRLFHDRCRLILPPVVIREEDVLLEHAGGVLLTNAAVAAIDAGLTSLSCVDDRQRMPTACSCAA